MFYVTWHPTAVTSFSNRQSVNDKASLTQNFSLSLWPWPCDLSAKIILSVTCTTGQYFCRIRGFQQLPFWISTQRWRRADGSDGLKAAIRNTKTRNHQKTEDKSSNCWYLELLYHHHHHQRHCHHPTSRMSGTLTVRRMWWRVGHWRTGRSTCGPRLQSPPDIISRRTIKPASNNRPIFLQLLKSLMRGRLVVKNAMPVLNCCSSFA